MDGYQATCECGWAGPVREVGDEYPFAVYEQALTDASGHACRTDVLLSWKDWQATYVSVPTATVTVLRKVEVA